MFTSLQLHFQESHHLVTRTSPSSSPKPNVQNDGFSPTPGREACHGIHGHKPWRPNPLRLNGLERARKLLEFNQLRIKKSPNKSSDLGPRNRVWDADFLVDPKIQRLRG